MREILTIACEGDAIAATLDHAPGPVGLLIVSGGNEVRIGAHRGMARLAAAVAARGFPVLRFDRRGIGDSEGSNRGFESSSPDITAAALALRERTGIARVVAFGNCDAATALVVHRGDAAIDALILSNPWVVQPTDDLPAPAAIRGHYADRLRDPAAWRALVAGQIDLRALMRGLAKLGRRRPPNTLAVKFAEAMAAHPLPTTILLARRDGTAMGFEDSWKSAIFSRLRADPQIRVETIETGSHSYAGDGDFEALVAMVVATLTVIPAQAGIHTLQDPT